MICRAKPQKAINFIRGIKFLVFSSLYHYSTGSDKKQSWCKIDRHCWEEGEQDYNPAVSEQTLPLWADGYKKQPNPYRGFRAGAHPKAQSKRHS